MMEVRTPNLQSTVVVNAFFRRLIHRIVYFHYGCLITTPVAVIRSREDGYDTSVMLPLVALHNQLMGTRNKV
jgi:hypothetical protein